MPSIRLNKKNNTIKVVNRKDSIKLRQERNSIKLQQTGRVGPPGKGLPAGGDIGQIPYKASDDDWDIEWRTPTVEDKTFLQYFSGLDFLQVNHQLNKFPSVTIIDSAGDEVIGAVDYIDANTLAISFGYPTSGSISCN